MIVGSQQRSKISLVSNLLKNIANFRAWREAQSSIRVQEGPPSKNNDLADNWLAGQFAENGL